MDKVTTKESRLRRNLEGKLFGIWPIYSYSIFNRHSRGLCDRSAGEIPARECDYGRAGC